MAEPPSSSSRRQGALWLIVAAGVAILAAAFALAKAAESAPTAAAVTAACLGLALVFALTGARRLSTPTAFERAAMESARPEAPYAEAMEAIPDPVLVITAAERDDVTSRRYLSANLAARRLLRLERNEGLLVSAVRDPEVLDAADAALFDGRPAERIYTIAGAQERTLKVLARPAPRLGTAGTERLAILVFRDETELRQVERTRADFLANASHELRTPLASLSGFIETLRGHAKEDPGARDRFLGIMQVQAERMNRLIDDLMSLSRIELNEYAYPVDIVDLKACAMEVAEALSPLARERGVRLEPQFPEEPVLVYGDRDQIVQVTQNLADNALKYSSEGQVIRIVIGGGLGAEAAAAGRRPGAARFALLSPDEPSGLYAAIHVADQGPGIARGHLSRLTERFYRVEGQKAGPRAGTGLGLAIVKHIANRHRGGMVVESELGHGATFTVYVPQVSLGPPGPGQPATSPSITTPNPSQSPDEAIKLS
ncbi:sensor histidine kinase [Phenylobacterium immobile]|uniref:sensor histidine kinase n=1 Tax=Phenylobacterium immobile TaxID=21 RepID=UPI000ADE369D|nr:ATP-binding protein [Phenylobacterium immobile]